MLNQHALTILLRLQLFRQKNPKLFKFFVFFVLIFLYKYIKYLLIKPKSLANKVILITGGVSGIGRLVALKCKKHKAKVIVWDINDDGISEMSLHVDASMKVDVSNRDNVFEAAKIVLDKFGYIDILINNAGIVSGKELLKLTEKEIRKKFELNVIAHFWTVQAFFPLMLSRKDHEFHIVTIASTASKTGVSRLVDYCTSKFAVRGFDSTLRHELGDLGYNNIILTCIHPYFINTGMFEGASTARNFLLQWFCNFLEPDYIANEIVECLKYNKRDVILPYQLTGVYLLEPILPYSIRDWLAYNAP